MNKVTRITIQEELALQKTIFELAKTLENVDITEKAMHERLIRIIASPVFSRELLVEALESHDFEIMSDIRFDMTDNVDSIMRQAEMTKLRNQEVSQNIPTRINN